MHGKTISCFKCGEQLCYAADSGEKFTTINVVCVCGQVNKESFLGFPKLAGTDKYYFEFVDENKIVCKLRNNNRKK